MESLGELRGSDHCFNGLQAVQGQRQHHRVVTSERQISTHYVEQRVVAVRTIQTTCASITSVCQTVEEFIQYKGTYFKRFVGPFHYESLSRSGMISPIHHLCSPVASLYPYCEISAWLARLSILTSVHLFISHHCLLSSHTKQLQFSQSAVHSAFMLTCCPFYPGWPHGQRGEHVSINAECTAQSSYAGKFLFIKVQFKAYFLRTIFPECPSPSLDFWHLKCLLAHGVIVVNVESQIIPRFTFKLHHLLVQTMWP